MASKVPVETGGGDKPAQNSSRPHTPLLLPVTPSREAPLVSPPRRGDAIDAKHCLNSPTPKLEPIVTSQSQPGDRDQAERNSARETAVPEKLPAAMPRKLDRQRSVSMFDRAAPSNQEFFPAEHPDDDYDYARHLPRHSTFSPSLHPSQYHLPPPEYAPHGFHQAYSPYANQPSPPRQPRRSSGNGRFSMFFQNTAASSPQQMYLQHPGHFYPHHQPPLHQHQHPQEAMHFNYGYFPGQSQTDSHLNPNPNPNSNQNNQNNQLDEAIIKAAIKIQKVVRGFLKQKKYREEIIPQFWANSKIAAGLVDELLTEFLVEGFIPDVLIDIFTHHGSDYDPATQEDQLVFALAEEVSFEVLDELITLTVKGVVRNFIGNYLQDKYDTSNKNPLALVMQDTLNATISEEIQGIVKQCIGSMVSDYLFLQHFDVLLHSTLEPLIEDVVHEARMEVPMMLKVNEIEEEVLTELCLEVVTEVKSSAEHSLVAKRKRNEFQQVSRLAQQIIQRSMLRLLVQAVSSNSESILVQDELHHMLSKQMARSLYSKVHHLAAVQREMMSNAAIQSMHQAITTHSIFVSLIESFEKELSLDEKEIHRRELKERGSA